MTIFDEIRTQAYLKWEQAGYPDGMDVHFWLIAEKEFFSNPVICARCFRYHTKNLPDICTNCGHRMHEPTRLVSTQDILLGMLSYDVWKEIVEIEDKRVFDSLLSIAG